ncbi:MAG: hypothetical protein KGO05_11885 [Chloroflexota bacterium]|nr:hypothetical protein [Chloroflexota bacterium]
MSDTDSLSTSDAEALRLLDEFYASWLGCSVRDLRRPGWTTIIKDAEDDPMTLLFGARTLAHIIAPVASPGVSESGEAGVATLAPELRESLGALLRLTPPQDFYHPGPLDAFDTLIRAQASDTLAASSEGALTLWYVTRERWQPRYTQWQEWVEQLDPSAETDAQAIALLARHGGGVFVVRRQGAIIAHIGLRAHSPQVWEALAPALTPQALAAAEMAPVGLVTALLMRATRHMFRDGRQPLCATRADDTTLRTALRSLGYQPYARATIYTTAMP